MRETRVLMVYGDFWLIIVVIYITALFGLQTQNTDPF